MLTTCFVSQCFWPEQVATSEMLSGVVFGLAERGLPAQVVAGQPTYDGCSRLPVRMEHSGVPILRLSSTRLDKNTAAGRVLNTASFAANALKTLLLRNGFSQVVATSVPPIVPWLAALSARLRRRTYILLIYDVYPEIAVRLGRLKRGGAVETLWRSLNQWAYRGAEAVVVLGECAAAWIRKETSLHDEGKVAVIGCWADGDAVKPMPRQGHPLLREWGLEDRFVVQYSGNIGLAHELRTVVEAACILRGQNIQFLFIGKGAQRSWLEEEVNRRELRNITLLPFQRKGRLPLTLTACDAGLVTLKSGLSGLCVPSKLAGILAAGKPVIAIMDEEADVARAVRRYGCGVVVRPGDARDLAKQIQRMKRDPGLGQQFGRNARRGFERDYALGVVVEKFQNLLSERK